jgi:hypothetical protein
MYKLEAQMSLYRSPGREDCIAYHIFHYIQYKSTFNVDDHFKY